MKDIIKTCGCGLTFREPKEAQGHCPACVTRARSEQSNEVVRAEGEDVVQAAWSDAAREAALQARRQGSNAHRLTGIAEESDRPSDHKIAAAAHEEAANAHERVSKQASDEKAISSSDKHFFKAGTHREMAAYHQRAAMPPTKATDSTSNNSITASGNSEGAKKGWGHRVHVVWTDRNYEPHKKTFYNDPDGPAGNAHTAAKKFGEKLESDHGKSKYGSLRDLSIHHEHEDDENAKASDTTSTDIVHCRASSAAGPVSEYGAFPLIWQSVAA